MRAKFHEPSSIGWKQKLSEQKKKLPLQHEKEEEKTKSTNGFNSYLFAHTDDEFQEFSDWSSLLVFTFL
jgi:hypothetical protein